MQIKFIQRNSHHNPLRVTGKVIKCRQGKSQELKELYDEPSLKDGELSVTVEVADLGVTVNCFLVTLILYVLMVKKRTVSTRCNTKAFSYSLTDRNKLCVFWTQHFSRIMINNV